LRRTLKGRTEADLERSIEYLNQAIALDPVYALAYAGLADAYLQLPNYANDPKPEENFPKARAAAQKALEIDFTLAEPHATLAVVLSEYDFNFAEAEKEFKRAIEINLNYASAHQWYAEYLMTMGRFDETIAEAMRAQQLEPLSLIINSVLGLAYNNAGRYDEAIAQLRKTLEIDPNFPRANEYLEGVYEDKGMYEEAIEQSRKNRLQGGVPPEQVEKWITVLREGYRKSGGRGYWQKYFESSQDYYRAEKKEIPLLILAYYQMKLGGNKEQVLDLLEKAFDENKRDPNFIRLKMEPAWRPLDAEARFQELLRKIGFPQ
jgi:tetratricopeptide (TPR) repeat protein